MGNTMQLSTELCDLDYKNVGSVSEKYRGVGGSTMD